MSHPLTPRVMPSVRPLPQSPREVQAELRARLRAGARLLPAGLARRDPLRLLGRYAPRHQIRVFDTCFYLGEPRENDDIRFFVGFVACAPGASRRDAIFPRIFYKDVSLVWRVASHFVRSERENWIGKGDVHVVREDGCELLASHESTADLPLEVQTAFENLLRGAPRIARDDDAVPLVLRRGPDDRISAYRDFTAPRRRAQADRRNLVNGGREVARFTRRHDPASLRFAPGYRPDFARGVLEVASSASRLYGGRLRRFRILSENRRIQWLFMAAPKQVWIVPPQALTSELSSYGVRTVDVPVAEELCVPGYEYHQPWEGGESQIPPGYAGAVSPMDPTRHDASPWLEQLPVIQEFRARLLRRRR